MICPFKQHLLSTVYMSGSIISTGDKEMKQTSSLLSKSSVIKARGSARTSLCEPHRVAVYAFIIAFIDSYLNYMCSCLSFPLYCGYEMPKT